MKFLTAALNGRHPPVPGPEFRILAAFILGAGPLAWFAQFNAGFMLATRACYPYFTPTILPMAKSLPAWLHVFTALALVVTLAALFGSWRLWRESRKDVPPRTAQPIALGEGRTCFLAVVGMIVNSLFTVACLFNLMAYTLVPVPLCG